MKLAGLFTIATLAAAAAGPALAQGTGPTTQGGSRYSIDGPGGGVPTSRPQATRPVPSATPIYPYGRASRQAPPVGHQTGVPLRSR
ncbi:MULTISPECIES: hypothetical protein [unclassified Bradyrhizobium]